MAGGHTTREEIKVAVANEAGLVPGILLPYGEHLDVFGGGEYSEFTMTFRAWGLRGLTRVPCLPFEFNELDAEKVLVNIQDSWHDLRHGEVLLDQGVVELQGLLDELAVVIPVIPKVEFAIERQTFLVVFLFLEC